MSEPNWKAVGQLGAQLLDLLTKVREIFKAKGVGVEIFGWAQEVGQTALEIALHCLAGEYLEHSRWPDKAPGLVYKSMLRSLMESAQESGNGPEALSGLATVLQEILHSRSLLPDVTDNDRYGIERLSRIILHVLNRPKPDPAFIREKLVDGLQAWDLQLRK